MSRLSKLQRKAALLRFHLIKHGDFPKNEKHRIDLLGITRAGLEKWIRGEVLRPRSLESVDERVKEVLVLDSMMPNLFENYIGVMEFGKLLGLTRRECQIAIDTVAGELGPTFSIFSIVPSNRLCRELSDRVKAEIWVFNKAKDGTLKGEHLKDAFEHSEIRLKQVDKWIQEEKNEQEIEGGKRKGFRM